MQKLQNSYKKVTKAIMFVTFIMQYLYKKKMSKKYYCAKFRKNYKTIAKKVTNGYNNKSKM